MIRNENKTRIYIKDAMERCILLGQENKAEVAKGSDFNDIIKSKIFLITFWPRARGKILAPSHTVLLVKSKQFSLPLKFLTKKSDKKQE